MNTRSLRQETSHAETATVRDFAKELQSHVSALRDEQNKISTEKTEIAQAREEIRGEMKDEIKEFLKSELTETSGERFERLADLAQNTPELGKRGLRFHQRSFNEARKQALESLNAGLSETVDVESFTAKLQDARANAQEKKQELAVSQRASAAASQALRDWQKSPSYTLVKFDEELAEKGAQRLTQENRAYYEPKGLVEKIINYVTRGTLYRHVRDQMKRYNHGVNGKDIFADLGAHKKKTEDLQGAAKAADQATEAADAVYSAANKQAGHYEEFQKAVKPDSDLLTLLQAKALEYFETPEFLTAVANEYGEDFPRAVPLMKAKIDALTTLEEGVNRKMQDLHKAIDEARIQKSKMDRCGQNQKVQKDLEQFKAQNRARVDEFRRYREAANQGRTRTVDYTPSPTVVYVDRSPSFFEQMLLLNMMDSMMHNHHHHDHGRNRSGDFVPSDSSAYAADLMGLDKTKNADLGLPDTVFDLPADVTTEMGNLGLDDYKVGSATGFEVLGNTDSDIGRGFGQAASASGFDLSVEPEPVQEEAPRSSYSRDYSRAAERTTRDEEDDNNRSAGGFTSFGGGNDREEDTSNDSAGGFTVDDSSSNDSDSPSPD